MTVGLGLFALFLAFVILVIVTTMLVIAAPWEGGRVPLRDHWRIGRAVIAVDFWLELRAVSGKRRRDLRAELRANLYEAARADGSAAAVSALGSLRELSAGYAQRPAGTGANWGRGATWSSIVLLVIAGLSLVTTVTWVDASMAAGADSSHGRPLFSPWLEIAFKQGIGGDVSLSAWFEWWVILIPALAFVIGARAWRRTSRTEAVT